MDFFLACGGGFLLAVIWMDLMFDVLAVPAITDNSPLVEESLSEISGYYRRVTTDASPMNYLVSLVMTGIVGTLLVQLVRGDGSRSVSLLSLAICAIPIGLALTRVFPNAVRLGGRGDGATEQSRLARSILIDHVFCFGAMLAFVAVRFLAR